ncbi:class I SAM-dependent methyltransferase [Bacillus sp. JJ1521]|uniref:class I SAM-dependent methyltransferase n=1 Tax=Bacillus sp. JJ1521 TaxID=3122957 RepID=UPI002FFFEA61
MAVFQIRSSNPRFSFVVGKNPNSGMVLRTVRKGKIFGWFSDVNTYNVYFKDAENDISYPKDKDEQFEYLNVSRYNTPLFPLNVVADLFATASKKHQDDDIEGFEHHLMVNLVLVEQTRYLHFFKLHFKDFELFWEELAHQNYRITIKTKKSLYELFNYSNTLFMFLSLMNRIYFDMTNETIEKYIRNINAIDAPFFIRYLFVRNVLTKKEKFHRYKGLIEETSQYQIDFAFGNTANQRKDWITRQLEFRLPIIDVGCGEGAYSIPFSTNIIPHLVHSIDIDEAALLKVSEKANRHDISNIVLYESIDQFLANYTNELADVLLTEVIEHMDEKSAEELILKIIQHVNCHKLIITTPNRDFNQFYDIELRHYDHQWEMNEQEFKSWIQSILPPDWNYSYHGIGDKVNGIHTTQGLVLTYSGGEIE